MPRKWMTLDVVAGAKLIGVLTTVAGWPPWRRIVGRPGGLIAAGRTAPLSGVTVILGVGR